MAAHPDRSVQRSTDECSEWASMGSATGTPRSAPPGPAPCWARSIAMPTHGSHMAYTSSHIK